MADINKFTTKEVLNKVLLDSSGNAVAAYSHTSQEALNAVLDSANSRLNVSLVGGTISGDVTISGDLTVNGNGSGNYDEIVNGNLQVGSADRSATILEAQSDATKPSFTFTGDTNTGMGSASVNQINFITDGGTRMTIDPYGNVRGGNAGGWYLHSGAPSSTVPAFTFADDTNTGMGQDGADNLTFISGGSKKLQIDSNGATVTGTLNANLGLIKASSGDTSLIVDSLSGQDANLILKSDGGAANEDWWTFRADNDQKLYIKNGNTDLHALTSAGLVGIANLNPGSYSGSADDLVVGTTGHTGITIVSGTSSGGQLYFADGTSGDTRFRGGVQYNHSNDYLSLIAGGLFNADTVNIKAGKLGVGTIDPSTLVEIQGGDGTTGAVLTLSTKETGVVSGDVLGKINFQAPLESSGTDAILPGASIHALATDTFAAANNETALIFSTASSDAEKGSATSGAVFERMRVLSSGKIGIGTETVDSQIAEFKIDTSGSDGMVRLNQDGSGTASLWYTKQSGFNWNTGINSAGNFVIASQHNVNGAQKLVIDTNSRISLSNNDNNTSNTIFGKSAFNQGGDVGADYNSFFGEGVAGTGTLSTATGNVGMGWVVLQDLTSGSNNVVLGAAAGHEINSGNENIIIGSSSGESLVGVQEGHVAIGSNALGRMATANEVNHLTNDVKLANVALGYYALSSLSGGGDSNIAIGTYAYGGKTSGDVRGSDNVIIGTRAGKNLTDSDQNIVIGKDAFSTASTTSKVVAIGHEALKSVNATGANETVAIGHSALTALTSGAGNTAIGYKAASELTDNSHNTAVGYQAMYQAGAAVYFNTFIGSNSGSGDWSGGANSNTAVGASTMTGVMTAASINNVAIGRDTLNALTTGSHNTAVGKGAGVALTGGHSNVIIGKDAYKTSSSGHGVVAIGFEALKTVGASGFDDQQAVAVGYQAGATVNTGRFNTLLGYKADVGTATDSYQTSIGHHGIIKYKTARMNITKAHSGDNTVVAQICKIPALSIIHRVTATVITKSNLGTYILNLSLSTTDGSDADAALVNASTTITVPEILGAGGVATYAQNSATVLGTAADIVASSGATNKTVYTAQPTTTIVGTADTFLYICNAGTGNGTTDSANVVIDIVVEYQGTD